MVEYIWQNKYPPDAGQGLIDGRLAVVSNIYSPSATARAFKPGEYEAVCGIRLQYPDGHTDAIGQPSVFVTGTCAAIGGVLSFSVYDRELDTHSQDGGSQTGSHYLQYFDYPHGSPRPYMSQRTQKARCTVEFQPVETLVTWDLPSVFYSLDHQVDPNSHSLDLAAESAFKDIEIRAYFELYFLADDGETYYGFTDDITTSVPQNVGIGSTGAMRVRRLSGHRPQALTDAQNYVALPLSEEAPEWQCGHKYWFRLDDQAAEPMPGVWIQERFIGVIPSGARTNTVYAWVTGITPGTIGWFTTPDWLFWIWPWSEEPPPPVEATHRYWAGNKSSVGTNGVGLETYRIKLHPGRPGYVVHVKQ